MSIQALSWVLKLEVARSSEKFILVCLANYADERGIAYPSAETLARDTGQDRKTVTLNLKRLCESGLLRDTGRRIGATGRVPVYQLVGMPSASGVHYTFRVTNLETGEFHIGVRSFNGDPELDVYRGSSKWVMDMVGREIPLHREVLEVFDNPVEAMAAELRLFRELGSNPLCRNEQAPRGAPRDMQVAFDANEPKNGAIPNPPKNGGIANTPVFPANTTVFPGNTTVFPQQSAQKRATEPPVEPSANPPAIPTPKKAAKKPKAAPAAPVVVLPDWLPQSVWDSWVEHRNTLKAPLTDNAARLCIKWLTEMRAEGHDPVASIEQSVRGGKWTDLYHPKKPTQTTTAARGGQPFNAMNSGAFDDLDQPRSSAARPANGNHGVIIDVDARSVDTQA
jgi:hypothetical protein